MPIAIGAFGSVTKGLLKGLSGFGNKRTIKNHQNYDIIENGQNTEKSLGDVWRLSVTQIPVKDHQLTPT